MRAIIIGAILLATCAPASADGRCRQLEELSRQYAGVTLTAYERAVKVRLVNWYRRNCK